MIDDFKINKMKSLAFEFHCKTILINSLKCKKYAKEVSTVLKNDKIVCYLQDL